jgi:predicted unusual protein kinase regulating ubiquinone biosynthesis (AarF/ABC1/UbiB family)
MPDEPRQPPTSRLARSARLGGLVAGQSARWVGTRAANVVRTPERADEATGERAAALARELVEQLGQMRGAAMKVGQVLSTIDFTALPEDERENFKQTLAQLRDDVPPLPFKRLEKLLREELGEKPSDIFAEFDEEAFAAASIGQVHRAVTLEGKPVAVKVQYPGVAEAVETDLRNLSLLLPLVRRLAPGLDVKALYAELRERIAEELDYELEAQHQRAVSRAHRGHPFAYVPEVFTELSSRRVLVTELIRGARFEEVKQRDEATRDRVGEIVFRFYFGLVHYMRRVSGDPHPGNYLLMDDGRIGFLDFGLMRVLDEDHMARETAVAVAMDRQDPQALHTALSHAGYLPEPDTFVPEDLYAQIAGMGAWYLEPGERRFSPRWVAELLDSTSGPRSPYFAQMRRQTLPPPSLLMRRMEGLVLSTLGELRACADWNAISREYYAASPASTPLGEAEHAFWARNGANRRSITATASGDSSITT